MAYTLSELDEIIANLEADLKPPESVIAFSDGRRVEYKPDAEKLKAIAYFQGLRATAQNATSPRIRQIRLYSRGN